MSANVKKSIDMTQGSILSKVLLFALPLMLGNLLQLLYNAADLIVVGRFAGSSATASVGATSAISGLIVNFCVGISVGASVLVSRYFGAKNAEKVHRSVHTAIALSFVAGIVAMALGLIFSRPLLTLMGTPKGKVLEGAVLYMRICFMGVPATMVYNFGASILRAIGDTKRPLYILSVSGIVNVILNLVLVICFHLGVAGVAIATAVSNYISAVAVLCCLSKTKESHKLYFKKIRFYKTEVIDALTIGIPAGIQSSVFAIANSTIQSAVNSFGADSMAGNAAAGNIEGFVYTAMNAFYQATLTSVSQNYGAKQEKRIYKTIKVCLIAVIVTGLVLGVLSVVFAKPLLGIYITDSDKAIDYGVTRMMYMGLPYFLCGIMEVMAGVLRGTGHSNLSMVNSLLGACGLRVLWVSCVLPLNHTPEMLFLCWPISWIAVIAMHTIGFLVVRKHTMLTMRTQ